MHRWKMTSCLAITVFALGGGALPSGAAALPQDAGAVAGESGETRVELVSAGSAPRRELRYSPKLGETERMTMTMQMSVTQSMNGQPMGSMEGPTTTMVMETTASKVLENGDIEYTSTITKLTAEGGPQAMQAQMALDPLVGTSGKGVMSARGISRSMSLDAPAGLPPQAQQQLESMEQQASQLGVPFPKEAVGAGAEWKVLSTISMGGISIAQVTNVSLVSVGEDGTITLRVKQEQSAEQQKLDPPQPGMEVEVLSMKGTGEFQTEVAPSMLTPKSSTGTTQAQIEMQVESPQMTAQMTQEMESTTTVKGEKAKASGG